MKSDLLEIAENDLKSCLVNESNCFEFEQNDYYNVWFVAKPNSLIHADTIKKLVLNDWKVCLLSNNKLYVRKSIKEVRK